MNPTVHIGIRAPKLLADALADIAALNGTTVSIEARRALWAYVERQAGRGVATAGVEPAKPLARHEG